MRQYSTDIGWLIINSSRYSFNKGTCLNGMAGWEVSLFLRSANAVTGFMSMTACFGPDFELRVHPLILLPLPHAFTYCLMTRMAAFHHAVVKEKKGKTHPPTKPPKPSSNKREFHYNSGFILDRLIQRECFLSSL